MLMISMALFLVPNTEAESGLTGGMQPIHLNMKEASDLSPETWGDNTRAAVKEKPPRSWQSTTPGDLTRGREWKTVGIWTAANGVDFEIGLGGPVKFNLWWRETDEGQDDSYNANVQYRFRLNVDGGDAAFYSDEETGEQHECAENEPCEWNGQVNDINFTSAEKGAIFELEIEYWAFSDIEIYYDNVTFNSGVAVNADAIKFGQSNINGQTVSFDFVQAWNTDAEEAVNGNLIRLIVDGVGLNSSLQKAGYPLIEDGKDYDLNGTTITSTKITWHIDDEYAQLDKSVISFSLNKRSCDSAPPFNINTSQILAKGSESEDESSSLPVPGFSFLLVIFALFGLAYYKREV